MTVKQFKDRIILIRGFWTVSAWVLLVILVMRWFSLPRSLPHVQTVLYACGTIFLFFWPLTLGYLTEKAFTKSHPEMRYLEEWTRVKNSPNGYPFDTATSNAFAPHAALELRNLGRLVNVAIAMRAAAVPTMRKYSTGSPEWLVAKQSVDGLNAIVEERNRAYLWLWHLYVDNLKVLGGHPYNKPSEFRESLLDRN